MAKSLAVLLAKPHLSGCDELIELLHDLIGKLEFEVLEAKNAILDGEHLYRNYLPHAFYAFQPFSAHLEHLGPRANYRIEQHTGLPITSHREGRSLQSAIEVVRNLGMQPVQLYAAWEESNELVRVQLGYQIKNISVPHPEPVWVVNGYFPYRFELYQKGSELVPLWLLALPDGTSVAAARASLLGDNSSPKNTLRGYLSKHHARLGIHIDTFNNGFHMSDTEAASIREIAIWFPQWLLHQPLVANVLRDCELPLDRVASILSSAESSFQLSASENESETTGVLCNLLGDRS